MFNICTIHNQFGHKVLARHRVYFCDIESDIDIYMDLCPDCFLRFNNDDQFLDLLKKEAKKIILKNKQSSNNGGGNV